jgi:antibiotic biosynthesis monooxygenase (ABM) superfamily enzyme
MNGPIHIAITRRIKPGCEAAFQVALKEFFTTSFASIGVHGASMLVPPPGSPSPEFGILRTFANERERDDFYASPMFKAWEEKIKPLTEGEPVYRQLNGLEAWFRSPQNPPPRWKMALLTWVAVWPVSMAVPAALNPLMGQSVPNVLFAGAVAGGIVLVLTWVAMPILVKLTKGWLSPQIKTTTKLYEHLKST